MSAGGPGRFVVVKGAAGLGNRILCALTGLLYARMSSRRLIVDWRDDVYSTDGADVFPRFFEGRHWGSPVDIPATDSVRPAVWRGHLHESARDVKNRYAPGAHWPRGWGQVSVDLAKVEYPEDVLVMWFFTEEVDALRRHFTRHAAELCGKSTKAILGRVVKDELALHPSIRERVDRFAREHFTRPVIGVHVRHTDRRSRLPAIRRKLAAVLDRRPGARIFLATDDQGIQKAFAQEYRSVVTTRKWFPASGLSIHRNPEPRDRTERGVEALVDMYLLAECDCLLVDESSAFAYVASLLASRPRTSVYNVQPGWWLPARARRRLWFELLRARRLVFT